MKEWEEKGKFNELDVEMQTEMLEDMIDSWHMIEALGGGELLKFHTDRFNYLSQFLFGVNMEPDPQVE